MNCVANQFQPKTTYLGKCTARGNLTCIAINYLAEAFSHWVVVIFFLASWFYFLGENKAGNVSALNDNDTTTCVDQDVRNPVLLKTTFKAFSSLAVTVVSSHDYLDPMHTCVQSPGHPWLLLTHFKPDTVAVCDSFCGTLNSCVYDGSANHSGKLFLHKMQCNCEPGYCNELALHIVPRHHSRLSICDILIT